MTYEELLQNIKVAPSLESFRRIFNFKTNEWKYWIKHNEFGTYSPILDIAKDLEQHEAFQSITYIADLLEEQDDSDLYLTCLCLLVGIIERSNSTQIPFEFEGKFESIKIKVQEINDKSASSMIEFIREMYRFN